MFPLTHSSHLKHIVINSPFVTTVVSALIRNVNIIELTLYTVYCDVTLL